MLSGGGRHYRTSGPRNFIPTNGESTFMIAVHKSDHDSAGSCVCQRQRKAWKAIEKAKLPRYYFDYAKERKSLSKGESSYTPATSLVVSLHAALNYIKEAWPQKLLIGNASLLAAATREAATALDLTHFAVSSPANAVTAINAPAGIESTKVVKEMRSRFWRDPN